MQSNCSNGMTLHFLELMFTTGEEVPQVWYSYLIYSTELVVLFVDLILAIILLYLIVTIKVIHINLTSLFVVFTGCQIPAHFGRMVFMYYEITDQIQQGDCKGVFIYSTISQLVYIHIVCHACVSFCLERLSALYHLQDYERKSRPLIPIVIISAMVISATLFAVDNILNPSHLFGYAIYILVLLTVTTTLLVLIFRWNRSILHKMEDSPLDNEYTLSKRFQLKENMRVITLAKFTIISVAFLLFFMCIIILHMTIGGFTPLNVMIFELLKSSCPCVVMLTTILAIDKWRLQVFLWLNIQTSSTAIQPNKCEDTLVYFQQLAQIWDQPQK